MKRVIFGIMAILTIFAMISCDNGTTPPKPENVTVTFYLDADDTTTAYATKTVVKGKSIGTGAFPNDPTGDQIPEGKEFLGWNTDATATTATFTANTRVNANTTVYAIWVDEGGGLYQLPNDAVVLGNYTVGGTNNVNGTWATDGVDGVESAIDIFDIVYAKYLVLDLSAAPAGAVKIGWQGDNDDWAWNDYQVVSDLGVAVEGKATWDSTNSSLKIDLSAVITDDISVHTQMKLIVSYYTDGIDDLGILRAYLIIVPPPLVPVNSPAGIEQTTLKNAFQVVYQFTLPDGKAWEDYETIDVTYMITDEAMMNLSNGARTVRLYGNYKPSDFELRTTTKGSKFAVVDYNTHNAGQYILADNGGGWKSIATFLKEQELTVFDNDGNYVSGTWVGDYFTMSFKLDGSTKNNSYVAANKPADDATGPFYFGLGISGQDDPTTSVIKEVIMVGIDPDDSFAATPAYFKSPDVNDTYVYPAYVGYGNLDGSAGEDAAKRKIITSIPKPVVKTAISETVTLKNAFQAMYLFTLPDGKAWEDYETIDVTFILPDEAMLNTANSARTVRLYGNYKLSDFELRTTTAGSNLAIVDYNTHNAGNYILADNGGGWKSIADFLKEKGLTVFDDDGNYASGLWEGDELTMSFKLDGSTKHGDYVAANKPADDATGPFYFGLGISGQDTPTTIVVKTVTMVGVDPDDSFDATPAYFKNMLDPADATEYPAYVGYGNLDGSAGEDDANREEYVEP